MFFLSVLFVSQIMSDTSLGEFDDTEILHLQEEASRLLQRGYEDWLDTTMIDKSIPSAVCNLLSF